jgi:dTDP-4-dehydrorhamnose reductase
MRLLSSRGEFALSTSRTELDFEAEGAIPTFFAGLGAKYPGHSFFVILAGAFTHVDGCEQDPKRCDRVNRAAPIEVAKACRLRGHKLLFFSSEYVFGGAEYSGGKIGPFVETDPIDPVSNYGIAKAQAEAGILDSDPSAIIVRTTVVYSWDRTDKNFAMQLLRHLESGDAKKFKVASDQISTPTYAPALADAAIELLRRGASGIYHVTGATLISRADFARKLAKLFGYDTKTLEFATTREITQVARRPLSAGLSTEKARREGLRILSLDEAFAEFRS